MTYVRVSAVTDIVVRRPFGRKVLLDAGSPFIAERKALEQEIAGGLDELEGML